MAAAMMITMRTALFIIIMISIAAEVTSLMSYAAAATSVDAASGRLVFVNTIGFETNLGGHCGRDLDYTINARASKRQEIEGEQVGTREK